jgi:hypothetical protein
MFWLGILTAVVVLAVIGIVIVWRTLKENRLL